MVPVSLHADLVDLLDAAPTARIIDVSSNEPSMGKTMAPHVAGLGDQGTR